MTNRTVNSAPNPPLKPPTCRSIYLAYVEEYLKELGEDTELVFRAAGITDLPGALAQTRIPIEQFGKVYSRVYQNARLPGFFVELGRRIPVTAHGNLGVAFIVSPNLGTLLNTLQRFIEIALPVVSISTNSTSDSVKVRVDVSVPCPFFKASLLESIASHMLACISSLTGTHTKALALTFQHKEPASARQLKLLAEGGRIAFNAPDNSLTFPATLLSQPFKTANRLNEQLIIRQCAEELARLHSHTGFSSRVRELVALNMSANPNSKLIAEKLSMSERSLRRHLGEEGASLRDIVKEVRHELACHYLSNTQMPVKEIAAQLSYSETASFSQSFRATAGMSPRAWRDNANNNSPEKRNPQEP